VSVASDPTVAASGRCCSFAAVSFAAPTLALCPSSKEPNTAALESSDRLLLHSICSFPRPSAKRKASSPALNAPSATLLTRAPPKWLRNSRASKRSAASAARGGAQAPPSARARRPFAARVSTRLAARRPASGRSPRGDGAQPPVCGPRRWWRE
jgi:hypothetical protein